MPDREPSTEVVRWADEAMYEAQPMLSKDEYGYRIEPIVFMLNATPDPLGTCAADMRMYRGDPVYSLTEITDEQRRWAWDELSKTALNTPLEGVSVKFMVEAVTRSFTHQMVRQRVGAYYVQESLRFAVKRGIASEIALPPSIVRESGEQQNAPYKIWDDTIRTIATAYEQLVDAGIPAEDARGLLPHAVTTRIIYHTNLRALFEHAGNRLCTQAQFEWRKVFLGIMRAMQVYGMIDVTPYGKEEREYLDGHESWQWRLIAEPKPHTFTPICYRLGKCAFKSELDRGCSIRERVDQFEKAGVESMHWIEDHYPTVPQTRGLPHRINRILPEEWLANSAAGMTRSDWGQERPPRSEGHRDDDPGE